MLIALTNTKRKTCTCVMPSERLGQQLCLCPLDAAIQLPQVLMVSRFVLFLLLQNCRLFVTQSEILSYFGAGACQIATRSERSVLRCQ